MTIVTIANNKGGAGKTTTAVSLAAGLANLEHVLLIDGDSQGQVGMMFGLPVRSGLFDWLVSGLPLRDCTLTGRPSKLAILPGDSLTKTVERLYGDQTEFDRLVERLRTLPQPYVIIDTAPGGLIQEAALKASDQVVIPLRPEPVNMDSVFQTLELIRQLAPTARITLLPTVFDARLKEHRETLQQLINEYGPIYGLERDWDDYVIRYRGAVASAAGYGQTVWEYNASGIREVRRAYAVLLGRVMAVEGRELAQAEGKAVDGTGD